MAQNNCEKKTLEHLLKCILQDLNAQEAAESGQRKRLIGLDKDIWKYGLVQRRAKTAYKKDERFLIIVPGKLFLFKGMDIVGKHVRFVASLFGATVRLVYGQLEFEVIIPDSKSLNLLTLSAEDLTGWVGAIEKSALFASEDASVSKSPDSHRARGREARGEKKELLYTDDQDSSYRTRRKTGGSPRDRRENYTSSHIDGTYWETRLGSEQAHDGRNQRNSFSQAKGTHAPYYSSKERMTDYKSQRSDTATRENAKGNSQNSEMNRFADYNANVPYEEKEMLRRDARETQRKSGSSVREEYDTDHIRTGETDKMCQEPCTQSPNSPVFVRKRHSRQRSLDESQLSTVYPLNQRNADISYTNLDNYEDRQVRDTVSRSPLRRNSRSSFSKQEVESSDYRPGYVRERVLAKDNYPARSGGMSTCIDDRSLPEMMSEVYLRKSSSRSESRSASLPRHSNEMQANQYLSPRDYDQHRKGLRDDLNEVCPSRVHCVCNCRKETCDKSTQTKDVRIL